VWIYGRRNSCPEKMTGYASAEYATSLAEFGAPLALPAAGGWLLVRELPGEQACDASGCYPLFRCGNWDGLAGDFRRLPADLVTVSLVSDPLTAPHRAMLHDLFPDVCYPYKDHYIADLSQPLTSFVAPHHQRNARRAGSAVQVERLENPSDHLAAWNALYAGLIERHAIRGIAAFSAASFLKQMQTPGLVAYRALAGEKIVGMVLWLVSDDVAYYHLAAYSDEGYELKASFALFWQCLEAFAGAGITHVALGSGAGVFAADQGLSRFKQGWSNEKRPAYFCGRILDRERYDDLVARGGDGSTTFFPAYRAPVRASAA
jgi:Acetyltransferase (GNAT) domain